MIYLSLFLSFLKIGLLAVGGGLATIPFLYDLSQRTGWFSTSDLTTMIAVSESTPGPVGINMATFTGFKVAGFLGGAVATFGLVLPAFLIILFLSGFLKKYRENKWVKAVFLGMRPCVTVLVLSFVLILLKTQISDVSNIQEFAQKVCLFMMLFALQSEYRFHPVFLIILGGLGGFLIF